MNARISPIHTRVAPDSWKHAGRLRAHDERDNVSKECSLVDGWLAAQWRASKQGAQRGSDLGLFSPAKPLRACARRDVARAGARDDGGAGSGREVLDRTQRAG